MARPDAALLLNVRPVHLENFASLSRLAEAKAEILAGLPAGGLLVANADDPEVARVARRHPGRVVWFGTGEDADVRLLSVQPAAPGRVGSRLTLDEITADLRDRLISLFLVGPDGRRPCFGWVERFQTDPEWKDNIFFSEYFHGDNGAGLGASHQTGWTGIVADLIIRNRSGRVIPLGELLEAAAEEPPA